MFRCSRPQCRLSQSRQSYLRAYSTPVNQIVESLHSDNSSAIQHLNELLQNTPKPLHDTRFREIRQQCSYDRYKLSCLEFMCGSGSARRTKTFSQVMFSIQKDFRKSQTVEEELLKMCETLVLMPHSVNDNDVAPFPVTSAALKVIAKNVERTNYARLFDLLLRLKVKFPRDESHIESIFDTLLLGTERERFLAIFGRFPEDYERLETMTHPTAHIASHYNLYMLNRVVSKLTSLKLETLAKMYLDIYYNAIREGMHGLTPSETKRVETQYNIASLRYIMSFGGLLDAKTALRSIDNGSKVFSRKAYLLFLSYFRKKHDLENFLPIVESLVSDPSTLTLSAKVLVSTELLLLLKGVSPDMTPLEYSSHICGFFTGTPNLLRDLGITDVLYSVPGNQLTAAKSDDDQLKSLKENLKTKSLPKSQLLASLYAAIFQHHTVEKEDIESLFTKLMQLAEQTQAYPASGHHTLSPTNFSGQVLNSFVCHLVVNRHMYNEAYDLAMIYLNHKVSVMGVFPETFSSIIYWKSTTNVMEAAHLYLALSKKQIPMSHHSLVGLILALLENQHEAEARGFFEMLTKSSYDFNDGYLIHEAVKRGWSIPNHLEHLKNGEPVTEEYKVRWKLELDMKAKLLGIHRLIAKPEFENATINAMSDHDSFKDTQPDEEFLPDELLV
ncbi:unnamed protein product [Kuraishia capsulata CBS 1993]|uniref:Uncharacterized protein n=1 Tax=Kuraishia capsulata CBS 1993 TaxID=1382522 RepID=W6MY15_9ASCO|nr:uncharacterized protein KUCA_T00005839001 [Kuraishia capsulata CBS 1993]CDK29845.1 unnamed protein product [Kuraishia capsulata CBS 1993]